MLPYRFLLWKILNTRKYQKKGLGGIIYGPVSFSIAQIVCDLALSITPIIVCASLWAYMSGLFFTVGIFLRYLLVIFAMIFTTFSFCYMSGCIIERSEVALVMTTFAFIIMLLFSGFVLRKNEEGFVWTDIFNAISLHRYSYFGFILTLFPPDCASSWATDDITESLSHPHYGILTNENILFLSGVPTDCNPVTLEFCIGMLFGFGLLWRIVAIGVLQWKKFR